MKVVKLEAIPVRVPYKHIEASSLIARGGVADVLVKITTDDGIVGWGECTRAADTAGIETAVCAMAPLVIGRDPWDKEAIHRDLAIKAVWAFQPQARSVWLKWLIILATPFGLPIFFGGMWSMYLCATVLERQGPFGALRRSMQLVDRHWFRVMAILFVAGMIVGDAVAVVADDYRFDPSERVPLKVHGYIRCVGVQSIPNELGQGLHRIARARDFLQVILFGFEGEDGHGNALVPGCGRAQGITQIRSNSKKATRTSH